MNDDAPTTIDAGLQLLDRQIVDRDGRMTGKVDDLELTQLEDAPPFLSALITGPGALSPEQKNVK